MPFEIIRNDITRVSADAIVNTANPEPVIGGGTDWAIHAAAGPELLEARGRIGAIDVGCSAATPAFRLSAQYVLHTVSPAWIDGRHGETEQLRSAYDAALALAAELGCRSVAFPLMAAGTYGFPHGVALATAVRAFTDFLLEHEMQITLVLFNAEACDAARSVFDEVKSYVDDNFVAALAEREYRVDSAPMARPRGNVREEQRRILQNRKRAAAAREDACPMPEIAFEKSEACPSSLEELLRSQRESSFTEYLLDLLRERGGKDSEVYKRAEISRQLFSKILNRTDYQPTKSTAIQLAIGLQLDLAQTQKLLGKAGFALTRSSRADLVVQYCIQRKIYSVTFINEALWDLGLPPLKTGLKS